MCTSVNAVYRESLRFREAEERERGPACLSYWRLSALASGARNTCSDFAVNRRSDDYPRVFRYERPLWPRILRAILSPGPVAKKKGKEKESAMRKIIAARENCRIGKGMMDDPPQKEDGGLNKYSEYI